MDGKDAPVPDIGLKADYGRSSVRRVTGCQPVGDRGIRSVADVSLLGFRRLASTRPKPAVALHRTRLHDLSTVALEDFD